MDIFGAKDIDCRINPSWTNNKVVLATGQPWGGKSIKYRTTTHFSGSPTPRKKNMPG
jgi:hypothetical protein